MRTPFRRSLIARLSLVVVLTLLSNLGVPWLDALAQDSGAATFTISSVTGNVVIKHSDGSGETAQPGTVLRPGDQLASVGRSQVTVNLSSPSGAAGSSGGGASLILFSDTTIGVRSSQPNAGAGGGGFFVADLASGVVLARTAPSGSTIQITSESIGAVAQLNRGGMAVATDIDVGTIAVACDERNAEVAFPYTDMRVPCESNVVRTLSNTRAIDDQRRNDDSPVNAVVNAAGERPVSGTGNQGTGLVAPVAPSSNKSKEKEEDSKPQVVASPAPSSATPCGSTIYPFRDPSQPVTMDFELGRKSGTFTFTYNGGGGFADTFDVIYEGHSLPGFPLTTISSASTSVSFSGNSTQVTVRVTPAPSPPGSNFFSFGVGCPS